MKVAIILLNLVLAAPALAGDVDKISHFVGAAVIGATVDSLTYHKSKGMGPEERIITAAGIAFVPGLAIETADEFSGSHFSWYDLLADGLGAVTGSFAAELVNSRFWISASGRQIQLNGRW